uniref:Uncharacterized protein n=1 Tax=Anguilla anguilla TaxID=7936 RepID=A0A0E9VGK2_ANGAN
MLTLHVRVSLSPLHFTLSGVVWRDGWRTRLVAQTVGLIPQQATVMYPKVKCFTCISSILTSRSGLHTKP